MRTRGAIIRQGAAGRADKSVGATWVGRATRVTALPADSGFLCGYAASE